MISHLPGQLVVGLSVMPVARTTVDITVCHGTHATDTVDSNPGNREPSLYSITSNLRYAPC